MQKAFLKVFYDCLRENFSLPFQQKHKYSKLYVAVDISWQNSFIHKVKKAWSLQNSAVFSLENNLLTLFNFQPFYFFLFFSCHAPKTTILHSYIISLSALKWSLMLRKCIFLFLHFNNQIGIISCFWIELKKEQYLLLATIIWLNLSICNETFLM